MPPTATDSVVHLPPIRQQERTTSAITGRTNTIEYNGIRMMVLEMEDVLFHLNSALMMPENPAGRSSSQGTANPPGSPQSDNQTQQSQVSGITALALAFKQLEFNPRLKTVIAAHADTSGEIQYNFLLSNDRGRNVKALLCGDEAEWVASVARSSDGGRTPDRHKIEDYQQVLTWVNQEKAWGCDPQGIDNTWGTKTDAAVEAFLRQAHAAGLLVEDPGTLHTDIKNHPRKLWPEGALRAIFQLYDEKLTRTLAETPAGITARRAVLQSSFLNPSIPVVPCGEAFPIDSTERDNYRSQQNRRVEVLFFDEEDLQGFNPAVFEVQCPLDRKRSVTTSAALTAYKRECPVWPFRRFFVPLYIDPADLYAQPYHLKFQYYNKVKRQIMDVPEGLILKAFKPDGTEIVVRTTYASGLYTAIVRFSSTAEKESNAGQVHFRFEHLPNTRWIYTSESDAAVQPVLVEEVDEATWNALSGADRQRKVCLANVSPGELHKYYDLPQLWDARHWRCAVGSTVNDFEQHRTTKTKYSLPIVFNLDDIVLVQTDGDQSTTDRDSHATAAHPRGQPHPLSNRSRVRILHADPVDARLTIYRTNPAGSVQEQHDSSVVRFQANASGHYINFLKDPPGNTRAIVFCGQFYSVSNQRTRADARYSEPSGHVLGARAAVLNDPRIHHAQHFRFSSPPQTVHCPGIGDFELHFLYGGGADAGHYYSYLIIYWSAFVLNDTNPIVGGTGDDRPATVSEVDEFRSIGMENSMLHWNKKDYQFEDHGGRDQHIVRPFFLFEAFEEFAYSPATPKDFDNDFNSLLADPDFIAARRNSRGGLPKSLAFVVAESKGSWVQSWRSSDASFSVMSLRIKTRQDDIARFAGSFPFNEFGDPGTYGCMVMAHEIGHATGQIDDYTEEIDNSDQFGDLPTLGQFGRTSSDERVTSDNSNFDIRIQGSEAYNIAHDSRTLMILNGPVRMRHIWRFTHWINERGRTGQPLNAMINGTQFGIHYPRANMRYYRPAIQKIDPWHFKHGAVLTVTGSRTMHAYLFPLLDETRRTTRSGRNFDFNAILTIRILVSVTFVDNGTHRWNDATRKAWNEALQAIFNSTDLRGKYMLRGGGGALDPAILRFIPGYFINSSGGAVPGAANYDYHLRVRCRSSDAITLSGKTLSLGDRISARALVNYFFNKPATDTSFSAADFGFVRDWFSQSSVGNGAFQVELI